MPVPLVVAPIAAAAAGAGTAAGAGGVGAAVATGLVQGAAGCVGGQVVKAATRALLPKAAASIGLGAVATTAAPWILGAVTVYQIGKFLFSDDKK